MKLLMLLADKCSGFLHATAVSSLIYFFTAFDRRQEVKKTSMQDFSEISNRHDSVNSFVIFAERQYTFRL